MLKSQTNQLIIVETRTRLTPKHIIKKMPTK
jgi:hypothetical protein